ncbi:CWF19-like protein 1 isoform X2 [Clavelina lepadiformis]|uniref:CWF19-like protein 1 isoform X2 n=1 Tax=Clavelina lepadiformis TaxID=159417 RepID=UPI0040423909
MCMLFCVGEFFGDEKSSHENWLSYRNGTKKAPIATYILGANHPDHVAQYDIGSEDGFEFCDNITFLGKKGIFTGSSGLRIAYLSGCESPAGSGPGPKHCFTPGDLQALTVSLNATGNDFGGVDILLTSCWPKGVTLYGNAVNSEKCKGCGSPLVSQLAQALKPRYHFAGLEGVHYERVPYRNHTVLAESSKHATRFIALAPVGNSQKQKYLYAFTITPMQHMNSSELNKQPPDTTECPYKTKNNKPSANNDVGEQFRWNMNYTDQSRNRKRKSDNNNYRPEKKQARPQDWSCWFCLGGEKVDKHLVASVGHLCYVALAKGGLTDNHVLILPIAHHPSSIALPDDTAEEVEKYKHAMKEAFASSGRPCVFFERSFRTDHVQIQVVPLPMGTTSEDVKSAFYAVADGNMDRQGKRSPLELTELPKQTDLKQVLAAGCPFFHVELPDGTRLLHRIQRHFPLQFGREALCSKSVLNMPDRIDWRSCATSRDQETKYAQNFRDFFKKFDFTFDSDDNEDNDDDEEN